MNKEAKKWVKFLKTNPPKHQNGLMNDKKDKRCCLGWALKTLKTNLTDYPIVDGKRHGHLNSDDMRKLGLQDVYGATEADCLTYKGEILVSHRGGYVESLAELNDFTSLDHAQIAEVIKENEHDLFEPRGL